MAVAAAFLESPKEVSCISAFALVTVELELAEVHGAAWLNHRSNNGSALFNDHVWSEVGAPQNLDAVAESEFLVSLVVSFEVNLVHGGSHSSLAADSAQSAVNFFLDLALGLGSSLDVVDVALGQESDGWGKDAISELDFLFNGERLCHLT